MPSLFLDHAKIFIKSGSGGSGAASFRREKYVPRGGPDGGDGGRGGHIIVKTDTNLNTLSNFRYQQHFKAEPGHPGEACNRSGKDGIDLVVAVPVGTVIKNAVTQEIIADLTLENDEVILLRGGRGGRGNSHFATSTRQTPQFAEKGEAGSEIWVELELKLLADVGFIGFPNVGKSTLLSRISAAKPEIADYPFTTIVPNLGVVDFKGESFVAVDIPGLIEGAHRGVGLGHQFLRHVERTRILVHLVDVSGLSGRDPYQDYLQINEELQLFNAELARKPQIVAANKTDLPEAENILKEFKEKIGEIPLFSISAVTGNGIDALLNCVIQKLAANPKLMAEPISIQADLSRVGNDTTISIRKENGVFVVNGESLHRRISRYDLSNDDSLRSLQALLKRWGVFQQLIDAGIEEGDSVRINNFEFIYYGEE